MTRNAFRIAACSSVVFVGFYLIRADEGSTPVRKLQPPTFKLHNVTSASFGEQSWFALTLQVTNPNDASLSYTGYVANSFDPPIEQGRIVPLVGIEFQRDGIWEPYPRGYCGTGLATLDLFPNRSAIFDVAVPDGDWDVVKVGISHLPGWSEEETGTTTTWSVTFTRDELGLANTKESGAS